MAIGFETKPNLTDNKFEQCTADILTLCGCTQVVGILDIHPLGSIDSCSGYKSSGSTIIRTSTSTVDTIFLGRGAGSNGTGVFNIAVSCYALHSNTTGNNNIALGFESMQNNTIGCYNVAIGSLALFANVGGHWNSAIGLCTLNGNTSGCYNIAEGVCALGANTTGCYNVAIGTCAGYKNSATIDNIAIGHSAAYCNTGGTCNIAIGYQAFYLGCGGNDNIAIGECALYNNYSGSYNIALGVCALQANTIGVENIAFGWKALNSNTIGSENIAMGFGALFSNLSGCHNIAMGNSALVMNTTGCNNFAAGCNALCYNGTGCHNIGIGNCTLKCNINGCGNTAFSNGALLWNSSGCNNFAAGDSALYGNTTACNNIAIGLQALGGTINTGSNNIALGNNTLNQNSSGISNFAAISSALNHNTTGGDNIAIGWQTLTQNTTGCGNLAFGFSSLQNNIGGSYNISQGEYSSFALTGGTHNVSLGYFSLHNNVCGNDNIAIGQRAGQSVLGSCNVFLGKCAGFNEIGSNKLYIANTNICTLIYGDFTGNTVTLPTVKICNTPITGTVSDNILVWNSTDKCVKQVAAATLVGGAATITGATNGLCVRGKNVVLGGALTGNTTISGAYTLNLCSGALLNTQCGYQISGSTILHTSPATICSIFIGYKSGNCNGTGVENIGIGTCTLYSGTTSVGNVAIGVCALSKTNGGGSCNVGIGVQALVNNTSGFFNVAIGSLAMQSNLNGIHNIAMGNAAVNNNTSGRYNIGLGYASLFNNLSGYDNVAIGSSAGYNSLGSNSVFIGKCAGYCETASNKLYIANCTGCTLIYGDFATNIVTLPTLKLCLRPSIGTISDDVLIYNSGTTCVKRIAASTLVGSGGGITTANNGLNKAGTNVQLGGALTGNTTITGAYTLNFCSGAMINNFCGYQISGVTLFKSGTGGSDPLSNIFLGDTAGGAARNGTNNIAIGRVSMTFGSAGCNNVAIGTGTMVFNSTGNFNTAIGAGAGASSGTVSGSRNVFLGFNAGYGESGSDKLHIANCGSVCDLISGDFVAKCVQIHGQLKITGVTAGNIGTDCVLMWNSSDKLVKQVTAASLVGSGGGITTANNGLIKTGTNVSLGGSLTGATIIDGGYSLGAGSIDSTFVSGTGFNNSVFSILQQSDGKILAGGVFTTYSGVTANRVIRLNSNGTIDSTFNSGSGFNDNLYSIVLQSDGKIVVVGYFTTYSGVTANHIIRLNSNGTIDSTFNSGSGFDNLVNTIALQSDGKFVVGGNFITYGAVGANHIIRLNSDGSKDSTFVYGSGFNNIVDIIALQSDGKILAGGTFTTYSGVTANHIIRLNSNGSIDNTFNSGSGFNNLVDTIALQSDGKILVGGVFTTYSGVTANYIIRLNSNGSIDNTFNSGSGFNVTVNALTVQPSDNKIIVGGQFTTYSGVTANHIIRLNSNGSIDNTFNSGSGFDNSAFEIILQSDSKIIVAGVFSSYNSVTSNRIIRLSNSVNTYDVTFKNSLIKYDADYSLSYDNRTLVDKEYVDNAVGGVSSMCTMTFTGNGTATRFTLNHAMSVAYPMVQVIKNVSPYPTVYTDTSRPDANNVCVTFDVAPANGLVYKVLIIK